MRPLLRRIRGAIGIGFTWGAVWAVAGLVPRWLFGVNSDVPFPLVFGLLGFIAGVTFSGLLALTAGRRQFDQLSLARFAGWGAIGGLVLSGLLASVESLGWADVLPISIILSVACSVCASGSLALARQAANRELPPARAEATKDELTP